MKQKYHVHLLYDVQGWAYYWRCLALKKFSPPDFRVTLSNRYGEHLSKNPCDLIFQCAYSYAKDVRRHVDVKKYDALILSSFNVGWGYCNKWLDQTRKYSDGVVINNYEMWDRAGQLPDTYHISNGIDRTKYRLRVPYKKRKEKIGWIGSRFHRKTKNYDTVLIPLKRKLAQSRINCDFRLVDSAGKNRMNQDQMAQWYNTLTMYVVASRCEGTPNPALEAASCGVPLVSSYVGNMPELIENGRNGYLVEPTVEKMFAKIMRARKEGHKLSENMRRDIQSWDWAERSVQYFDLMRRMIDAKKN